MLKATLALHHKRIPPNLNFDGPTAIDFASSPFVVNRKRRVESPVRRAARRRQRVGFGGTTSMPCSRSTSRHARRPPRLRGAELLSARAERGGGHPRRRSRCGRRRPGSWSRRRSVDELRARLQDLRQQGGLARLRSVTRRCRATSARWSGSRSISRMRPSWRRSWTRRLRRWRRTTRSGGNCCPRRGSSAATASPRRWRSSTPPGLAVPQHAGRPARDRADRSPGVEEATR